MSENEEVKNDGCPAEKNAIQHLLAALRAFKLYPNVRPLNVDLTMVDGRVAMGRPFVGPLTLGGPFLPDSTCPKCSTHVQDDFLICPECGYDLSKGGVLAFRERIRNILDKLGRSFQDTAPKNQGSNVSWAC